MSNDFNEAVTLGRLSCLVREPDSSVAAPRTVVLAHGLGANAWDLSSLSNTIDPRRRFRWIFPNAPVSLAHIEQDAARFQAEQSDGGDEPPSESEPRPAGGRADPPDDPAADTRPEVGRAWFPFDPKEVLTLIFGDYLSRISEQRPTSLGVAGMYLLDLINDAAERYEIRPTELVVGGFSQGAMVATEAVFQARFSPAALVVLSGALIDRERWTALAGDYGKAHPGSTVRYFQSHGTADPLLRYADARELMELFVTAGFVGEFHHFPGGHWIPDEIIWNLTELLLDL